MTAKYATQCVRPGTVILPDFHLLHCSKGKLLSETFVSEHAVQYIKRARMADKLQFSLVC